MLLWGDFIFPEWTRSLSELNKPEVFTILKRSQGWSCSKAYAELINSDLEGEGIYNPFSVVVYLRILKFKFN